MNKFKKFSMFLSVAMILNSPMVIQNGVVDYRIKSDVRIIDKNPLHVVIHYR